MIHFNLKEFDSPDMPNSGINMDNKFLEMLDDAREIAGIPFKINSGYRTENHNAKVGGKLKTSTSKGSSHMYGLAVDIACSASLDRFTIIDALLEAGFNRLGIAKSFIHVDSDPDKAPYVIWTY